MNYRQTTNQRATGFSLIEMAIVLFIIALLLGGLLPTLSGQIEQQRRNETRVQIADIQQALYGFAIINGRLPCPASSTSNGLEDPLTASTGVACNHQFDGFLPAATLGVISGTDLLGNKGYAVDGWGNRIRYAVLNKTIGTSPNAITTTNGMQTATLSSLSSTTLTLLYVCDSSSVVTGTSCGTATKLTDNAPAVIFSTGTNGASGSAGPDEAANLNNDLVFVSHANNPAYDDMVTWLPLNILISRMVSASKF